MTAPARFRQADLKRIFAAAKQAGVRVRVEPTGAIQMLTESEAAAQQGRNPWDEVLGGAKA